MIIFLGNDHSRALYEDYINKSKHDEDIVLSCQYPFRVPDSLLDTHICVNIHYGILPFYAGCNPIYWQIKKGYTAGVTLHYMDSGFDSGDIIDIYEVPIGDMTADELYGVLSIKGYELFKKYYNRILEGSAPRRKQNLEFRRYYTKTMVDFKKEASIEDKDIRALHFEGKQYPTVKIGSVEYEIRRCNPRF